MRQHTPLWKGAVTGEVKRASSKQFNKAAMQKSTKYAKVCHKALCRCPKACQLARLQLQQKQVSSRVSPRYVAQALSWQYYGSSTTSLHCTKRLSCTNS